MEYRRYYYYHEDGDDEILADILSTYTNDLIAGVERNAEEYLRELEEYVGDLLIRLGELERGRVISLMRFIRILHSAPGRNQVGDMIRDCQRCWARLERFIMEREGEG
ncbi:MAG: hypothetical protein ACUVXI_16820 [bacterium]